MDSFASIFSAVRRITRPIILRKLEMLFYFLFITLCFIGFILPSAMDVKTETFYTVGALSLIYSIGLYFFRLKIKISYGLVLHTTSFLLFLSFLVFGIGLYAIGTGFLVLALMGILVIIVLCSLYVRVSANRVNEPPINRAWLEIDNQANVDGQFEDQIGLNHWRFNDGVNPPEMQNDVNPEMLNNNVADPQMHQNDNINPLMLNNDVADPQMQQNDNINPLMLNNEFADPQMQQNGNINPLMLDNDVVDPQMQQNDNINPLMLNNDVADPQMQQNNNINPLLLNNDVADPQMQQNDNINPLMLNNDVVDPQMQQNDNINPEMLVNDVADPEMQQNDINPEIQSN